MKIIVLLIELRDLYGLFNIMYLHFYFEIILFGLWILSFFVMTDIEKNNFLIVIIQAKITDKVKTDCLPVIFVIIIIVIFV